MDKNFNWSIHKFYLFEILKIFCIRQLIDSRDHLLRALGYGLWVVPNSVTTMCSGKMNSLDLFAVCQIDFLIVSLSSEIPVVLLLAAFLEESWCYDFLLE